MTPVLTERRAWEQLARLWKSPERYSTGTDRRYYVRVTGGECCGLCWCVNDLFDRGMITEWIVGQMVAKLNAEAARLGIEEGDYLWPCDLRGATEGVLFCERLVKGLK